MRLNEVISASIDKDLLLTYTVHDFNKYMQLDEANVDHLYDDIVSMIEKNADKIFSNNSKERSRNFNLKFLLGVLKADKSVIGYEILKSWVELNKNKYISLERIVSMIDVTDKSMHMALKYFVEDGYEPIAKRLKALMGTDNSVNIINNAEQAKSNITNQQQDNQGDTSAEQVSQNDQSDNKNLQQESIIVKPLEKFQAKAFGSGKFGKKAANHLASVFNKYSNFSDDDTAAGKLENIKSIYDMSKRALSTGNGLSIIYKLLYSWLERNRSLPEASNMLKQFTKLGDGSGNAEKVAQAFMSNFSEIKKEVSKGSDGQSSYSRSGKDTDEESNSKDSTIDEPLLILSSMKATNYENYSLADSEKKLGPYFNVETQTLEQLISVLFDHLNERMQSTVKEDKNNRLYREILVYNQSQGDRNLNALLRLLRVVNESNNLFYYFQPTYNDMTLQNLSTILRSVINTVESIQKRENLK